MQSLQPNPKKKYISVRLKSLSWCFFFFHIITVNTLLSIWDVSEQYLLGKEIWICRCETGYFYLVCCFSSPPPDPLHPPLPTSVPDFFLVASSSIFILQLLVYFGQWEMLAEEWRVRKEKDLGISALALRYSALPQLWQYLCPPSCQATPLSQWNLSPSSGNIILSSSGLGVVVTFCFLVPECFTFPFWPLQSIIFSQILQVGHLFHVRMLTDTFRFLDKSDNFSDLLFSSFIKSDNIYIVYIEGLPRGPIMHVN